MSVLANGNGTGNEVWTFIWAMARKIIFLTETRDFEKSSK